MELINELIEKMYQYNKNLIINIFKKLE